ncbi:hypothetical protein B0H17DRAFT_1181407 [Mycena rosella]|uniref:Transmembrane protein n=1 Tax=Mycena rosella TaxID=1033263 RepID=A0AAD7GFN9_MYCRO|nr:hypothetical protein B0H17DRAFT_1181407 [Mycena rosella]
MSTFSESSENSIPFLRKPSNMDSTGSDNSFHPDPVRESPVLPRRSTCELFFFPLLAGCPPCDRAPSPAAYAAGHIEFHAQYLPPLAWANQQMEGNFRGWTTFIRPVLFLIKTPASGSELDLSSPFLHQMESTGAIATFIRGQIASGYALVSNKTGTPASFTLLDHTFSVSTAGILPATFRDSNTSAWFPIISVIPSTIHADHDLLDGLSSNYSTNQQGFSVDVTCEFQNITAIEPSLTVNTVTPHWPNGTAMTNITLIEMSANCPVPEHSGVSATSTFVSGEPPNYFMMISCKPAENYTLIFSSSGVYENLTPAVCNLSPKITRVNVDYLDPNSDSEMISSSAILDDAILDPDGPAGVSAVVTIADMMFFSQGLLTNVMADDIASVLTTLSDDSLEEDPAGAVLQLMAEYIRGVAEYSGSVFRACLSRKNGTFADGVPANMAIPTTGTIYTQTMCWIPPTGSSGWVLVLGTVVAFITILVVIVAVAQNRHAMNPQSDAFDPGDTMHLLSAAAAGGLEDLFEGGVDVDFRAAEKVKVVLGLIPGSSLALVAANTE